MPQLIYAVVVFFVASEVVALAIMFVATYLYSDYQNKKAKRKARDAYNASLTDRLVMSATADGARSIVYGRARNTDGLLFKGTWGGGSGNYTLVVALAGHEIDAIETVYVNDVAVAINGAGWVTTFPWGRTRREGRTFAADPTDGTHVLDVGVVPIGLQFTFVNGNSSRRVQGQVTTYSIAGTVITYTCSGAQPFDRLRLLVQADFPEYRLRIKQYLGAPGQDLSSELATRFPALITPDHKFQGVALLLVDMIYDTGVYPAGAPGFSAVIRGAKVHDPRTGLTAWSANPALCARDLALHANGGGCAVDEIDDASFIAAANACDVSHTYEDTNGVETVRALYTCGYVAKTDVSPDAHFGELVEAMAGKFGWAGGRLRVRAGAYTAPVATITADWLTDKEPRQITPAYGMSDLVNIYRPTIADQAQSYVVAPLPELRVQPYIDVDGIELPADTTMTAITFAPQAQHVCGVLIRDMRQGLTVSWSCNMRAYALELLDVVYVKVDRYGWTDALNKTFEVLGWKFSMQGGVSLVLKETGASIYTPDPVFTAADPEPNTALPAPWLVQTVTGVAAESGTDQLTIAYDGTVSSRIRVTWAPITDGAVLARGTIEVQYLRGDLDMPAGSWPSVIVPGDSDGAYLTDVVDGYDYVIQVRAANTLSVGDWSLHIQHRVIGKTEPPPLVDSFLIGTMADGTRLLSGGYTATTRPLDLAGYRIKYLQGAGPYDWADMQPFQSDTGFFTTLPFETNLLLAGEYTLGIVGVDTSGNESAAPTFIVATLPNPRLGESIEVTDERQAGWPGVLTDCVVEVSDGQLIVRARDQATWATLPATWSGWTRWVWDPVATFSYETQPLDFGAAVAVLPVPNYSAVGNVSFEVATSADGLTWSAYAAVASPVITRYIKSRTTVTVPVGSPSGPGLTPVCELRDLSLLYIGKVSSETGNDLDTSTLTGVQRIGVGDVRLPIQKAWVHISRISVSLQSVGPGWTFSIFDKDGADGPRLKIYNGSGALADAVIDWTVEGISA